MPVLSLSHSGVLGLIIIVVLVHLHLRRQRMDAKEWNGKHTQELDDYGLGDAGTTTKPQTAYRPASAQPPAAAAAAAPPASSAPAARRTSQDSLRSLENSLRHQQKPADMV